MAYSARYSWSAADTAGRIGFGIWRDRFHDLARHAVKRCQIKRWPLHRRHGLVVTRRVVARDADLTNQKETFKRIACRDVIGGVLADRGLDDGDRQRDRRNPLGDLLGVAPASVVLIGNDHRVPTAQR